MRLFVLTVFALGTALAAPASAQWPSTEWVVMDEQGGPLTEIGAAGWLLEYPVATFVAPIGERAVIADKHRRTLEAASIWFQSHGFPAPHQMIASNVGPRVIYLAHLKWDTSEIGSAHNVDGRMKLTSHPGFLPANTPFWELMEVSAVHELYHGIQKSMSPSSRAQSVTEPVKLPECPDDTNMDWLGEGTASMIQIRWLEGKKGTSWGHPFKGSHRAAWVRHFDQPLHMGSIPPEHQISQERLPVSSSETVSWACDYGTWYFWYALGDMIGRNDADKVAYTRYLFTGTKPRDDGGIANVDAGLKAAAAAYDAIGPYRGGLYDLYPQFVAQYLTEDRFYGKLEEVELGAPSLYQTTSSLSGGPLGPLATRAWRVRVRLPQNVSSIPYNVRFILDAQGATDRADLHLIVDDKVIGRPGDSTVPYAEVQRIGSATATVGGAVEYLVRVANVAEDASETADANFSFRVEVEGFYGAEADGPSVDLISGELPPGFTVRGPGPWTCSGNATARAFFDLVTPDEVGRDIDWLMPGLANSTANTMDNLEVMLKRMQQHGAPTGGLTHEQLALIRKKSEDAMAAARTRVGPKAEAAADRARAGRSTTIAATFVGENNQSECQMILGATLAGRKGGAQIVPRSTNENGSSASPVPTFDVGVYPAEALQMMRSLGRAPGVAALQGSDPLDGWKACSMNDRERRDAKQRAATGSCPLVTCTPGRLTLESAEQGRIAGSFQFEVIRWGDQDQHQCPRTLGRDTVTGHFNVTSTDDGQDDNSLGGLGIGMSGGAMITPGAPILGVGNDD